MEEVQEKLLVKETLKAIINQPVILILRGLPGSGKTTWISNTYRASEIVVVSTDNYRIDKQTGEYVFDPKTDDAKHLECYRAFVDALMDAIAGKGPKMIIVDNTNCAALNVAPYYRFGELFTNQISILTFYCSPDVAFAMNRHNVPLKTIINMYRQLNESLPSWWKEKVFMSPNMSTSTPHFDKDWSKNVPGPSITSKDG